MRRAQIDAKRNRIQDKFISAALTTLPVFRKTTRDYHVDKDHSKLQHGAPIGRYSPSYERVFRASPTIEIAGVKDRFGYENKNSPMYVKPAEGQASAAGEIDALVKERLSAIARSKKSLHNDVASRNRATANKTQIHFKQNGLSVSESMEEMN